jgi:acyl carrier protein
MALTPDAANGGVMSQLDRNAALSVVVQSLTELLTQNGDVMPATIDESTVLVGKDAVIDSLGMVSLIVEVEQVLETEHDVSVTLANDRAMSERNSPFRTVGVFADHVCTLIGQARQAA